MTVLGFEPPMLALVFGVVFAGGLVKGVAGFGYAITSTAVLATLLDPSVAVVVMILPMLVANLRLVGDLGVAALRSCVRRFWPYVSAAAVGTLAGMSLLGRIPRGALLFGLGAFTLAFVAVSQPYVTLPGGDRFRAVCFTEGDAAKVGLGLVSGAVFGATNVGVQVVAYLDTLDLDRRTFAGVLSMVLVGVSAVRVAAAWRLGLYGGDGAVFASAAAAVPGLVGVSAGRQVRAALPERLTTAGALALLGVIGGRLLLAGAGLA